jgi:integrase
MVLNEISKSPEVATRAAANCWNLAVRRIPEWPSQTFKLPNRKISIKLDVATFPPSFQRDLDRYVLRLEHPDPLDADANAAPLRPDTIRLYRASVLRFASVLVHAKMPIAEITSLAVLVTPEDAERGLRWLLARKDNAKTRGISEMAGLLRGVAKRYVRVDEACQKRLDKLDALLAVKPQNGMTAKNRDRLRPLDDPDTLRRLLLLPERLFKHAKADGDLCRGALAREDAVAVAILLNCPIRRKNLAEIHLEKNLQRPGDGRVFLVFEADEVKNDQRIEFELPKHVVGMIDRHLASRTPQLCPRGTPWLFPRRDGAQPIQLDQFAMRLKKRILKETGLQVNAHLFRHIAAKIWLDAHPGHYEALRRLLGHKELSQTINAYAGFEAGTATRLFADAVEQATR